ncbi:MAG: hypothetical protein QM742_18540 [Aquabacterium sp.]
MRRLLALTLALGAAHFSAMAAEGTGWGLRPFIGAGYTWGGDTMQAWDIVPVDGSGSYRYEEDVSAGAGLDLRVGLSYRLGTSPFTLQASVAHHIDQTHGISSRAYFRRVPAEILLQWHASEQWRLGMGVRRSLSATEKSHGGTCGGDPCPEYRLKLKSNTGVVIEAEYMATPNWGIKARYVWEEYRYKIAPDAVKYEGDHFGVMTNYYFD